MEGGSYCGMTQWQALSKRPRGLIGITPSCAVHPGYDFPSPGGMALPYIVLWLSLISGRCADFEIFKSDAYWEGCYGEVFARHLAFSSLHRFADRQTAVFDEWLRHPTYDEYWQALNPTSEEYGRMNASVLTITGYFDNDQPGALKYYRDHHRYASAEAAARHHLLIGPFSHAGSRYPEKQHGGKIFADNAVLDLDQVIIGWYRYLFGEGLKPPQLQQRVAFYVLGADEWRFADSLERISSENLHFYLHAQNDSARDLSRSGTLSSKPQAPVTIAGFEYDPLDLSDSDAYLDKHIESATDYLVSARPCFTARKLVYHTSPLKDYVTIAGHLELSLFVALNVPDTDLQATVFEVGPDESVFRLGNARLRVRYRLGADPAVLAQPGEINELVFSGFLWIAKQIPAGNRLRLLIQPINNMHSQKNYNSAEPVVDQNLSSARVANISVYHGGNYASVLRVPVIDLRDCRARST
jgi:putative CocE/NonD family hydrolase